MVFVTGGSGLVGSHLLMELLRSGLEVRALCRPQSRLDRVGALFRWYGPQTAALFDRIEWVPGDLNDIPSLEAAMEGVDVVYHCAALISFDPADEARLIRVNQEGTRNVVNLCLHHQIPRLVYTSSVATIGGTRGTVTEQDLWDPVHTNVYATSKHLAEMEVWRGGQEGLEVVIVNPGVVLGPGFWKQGSGLFFKRVADGMKLAPPGSTGFVGVRDVVAAMRELEATGCFGERFILVGAHMEFIELLRRIAGLLETRPPEATLKPWQLELLWRLDWVRCRLGGGRRRLSKAIARSLRMPVRYSSEKIRNKTGFEFQPLDGVLEECALNFKAFREEDQS